MSEPWAVQKKKKKKKALKENKLTQPKTKGYLLRSYDIWNFQHTSGKSQVSDSVGLLSLLLFLLFFLGLFSCLTTAQKRFSVTDNLTAIYTTRVICFLHCLVWRHSEREKKFMHRNLKDTVRDSRVNYRVKHRERRNRGVRSRWDKESNRGRLSESR